MADQVLTEQEINEIVENGQVVQWPPEARWFLAFARCVEAAVLAKRLHPPKPIYEMHPADATDHAKKVLEDAGYVVVLRTTACREAVSNAFGCVSPGTAFVTEREARKRERAAWDAARCHSFNVPETRVTGEPWDDKERDRRYPLPTKTITRPRKVVLSGCRTVSSDDDGFFGSPYYHAKTPADARLLADLVEHPTETVEVPDDE